MPKPHDMFLVDTAAIQLFGTKFGYISNTKRMYVRDKGKFVPTGYQFRFQQNTFNEITRKWDRTTTIRFASDSDLGI